MKRYQLYPSLLNEFYNYQTDKRKRNDEPYCTREQLIAKINRVKTPPNEYMLKGIAFEQCLMHDGVHSFGGFEFNGDLLERMRKFTRGGTWQTYLQTTIEVDGAMVKHYGFSDVIIRSRNVDCKTTGNYAFPSHLHAFQHDVYLLGANDMGIHVNEHLYLISDFDDYYEEYYPYDLELHTEKLRVVSRDMINFLEQNREFITDTKIFS